jgi:hypothetical protein
MNLPGWRHAGKLADLGYISISIHAVAVCHRKRSDRDRSITIRYNIVNVDETISRLQRNFSMAYLLFAKFNRNECDAYL